MLKVKDYALKNPFDEGGRNPPINNSWTTEDIKELRKY
jgi:hypothetical protein